MILASAYLPHPSVDFTELAPLLALFGGALVVLLVGLLRGRGVRRHGVPALTLVALGASIGLTIWRMHHSVDVLAGAIRVDDLALVFNLVLCAGASVTVLLSWRAAAPREAAHGEFFALLLTSLAGMLLLVEAQNLITLFLALELLSIPLYVLCATEMWRERSLEAGLKYLVIGSIGSATLLYGLAMLYGATGSTDFAGIARGIHHVSSDPLLVTAIALTIVGLGFKSSVAPFHQWTPDVYEGAPTPITTFMAIATKVGALGVFLRLFDVALIGVRPTWAPALAALATVTIIVGNVGALGQSSLKRMLAYSSVAQAGYMLAGVVVGTQLGISAIAFYLAVYLMMNAAAFAVVIVRERVTPYGDHMDGVAGLGRANPLLGWALTLPMLGLAGVPATAGFIGKFYLIDAAASNGYIWLGVMIVLGSIISLGYYLRVIAVIWMSEAPVAETPAGAPVMAGAAPAHGEVALVASVAAAGTLFFGIVPQPLFDLAQFAGHALSSLPH